MSGSSVLAEADVGIYQDGVVSDQDFRSGQKGHSNPTCFAVHRWLETLYHGSRVAKCSVVVSVGDLPAPGTPPDGPPECHKLKTPDGFALDIEMRANRDGNGAGGRKVFDTKNTPEVMKKGPDNWEVAVTVSLATLRFSVQRQVSRSSGLMLPAVYSRTSGGCAKMGRDSQVGCVPTTTKESTTPV